jgi:hypothetical protein
MAVLGLFSIALVMTVSGVAIAAHGNPFGISLVLLAFVPACIGSFMAGVVLGKDHSDGP